MSTHGSIHRIIAIRHRKTAPPTDPLADIQEGKIEYAPWALGKLLEHLKHKYGNPPVMIHENGNGEAPKTPSKIEYDDDDRSEFLQDHLEVLYLSIRNRSNARGYFVWSFLDAFACLFGYRTRIGLYGVAMNAEERTRYARKSARWYSGFLNCGELRPTSPPGKVEAYDVA